MSTPFLKIEHVNIDPAALAPALNKTPHDVHFGADYRCRSMSSFRVTEDEIELLPRKPLFQSSTINPIENYGGIERSYDDLPASLREHPDFQAMVRRWLEALPERWETFSVHHIRTRAGGDPTPEGRHRDGYRYVGIGVLQRDNIAPETGITQFWDHSGKDTVFTGVLDPGDLCIFDDRMYLHATSSTALAEGSEEGVRDVLIFTVPDHGAVLDQGEVH